MGRNRETRTGIAVLAFIVASATAQFNSPADIRGDCADKTDGIYPTDHCSTYFLECSGGRTTKQNCSSGLWFNPQSSQCDYRQNIVSCEDPFSCVGRDDGLYGEGCSSMFWYCTGGKLQHSKCPTGTFFNVDAKKCEFRHDIRACGGSPTPSSAPSTRSHRLTTVTATTQSPATATTERPKKAGRESTKVPYGQTYPTYAPRLRISGTVSKTPLAESSAGTACAGKDDGSHEVEKCSGQYVLCWAGTGQVMNCQQGLLFNEASGACDYPLNVAGCSGSSAASPSVYGGAAPVVSAAPSTATLPIPRQPADFDCSTRSDGVYGSCTREFFQCVAGAVYAKTCSEGLVYNPDKKQCDYKENCGTASSTVVASDAPATVIPVVATTRTSINFDCSSRPDGSYSGGCISEFYQCSAGQTYVQKCPQGLVFDDLTKGCDYPEMCSVPRSTAAPASAPSAYSRAPTTAIPAAAAPVAFDCSSRVDGSYSDGCVSAYFSCASGVAYSRQCPEGLVFDGVVQRCEYPHSCGQPRPLEPETAIYEQPQSAPQSAPSTDYTESKPLQMTPRGVDCSTRPDGPYSDSCSPEFTQCVGGLAYTQKCPEGLLFDQRIGNCDYPEKCGTQQDAVEVPVEVSPTAQPVQPAKPTLTPADIDCYARADGLYASGCSRTFVQCANGMAFNRLCDQGLVFVQETGRCDYPANCGLPSEETASALPSVPSTSSAPYKPSLARETPSATTAPPKRDQPAGVLIDCTSLVDGSYTSGCTHAFVQCVAGNAIPLECQAGLVFDKRVERCVWPEECSSGEAPALPTVSLPSRPSDVPSTVYDMKEEEQMVTDAPLPELSNDGTVCTGTGRRAMGKCSSGFVQCIGGKLIARRCPGQSLFDEKIGLCVYDLEGCEMDVDVVQEETDQHPTVVVATGAPQQDAASEYGSQPVQAATTAPSYPQQNPQQEQYYQGGAQTQYPAQYPTQSQPGYPTEYQSGYQPAAQDAQYHNGYQAAPAQQYQSGYPAPAQDTQYQTGYGYSSAEYQSVPQSPVYSSFGDSSLPSQSLPAECEIGSFRRVSACSASFDACSPTARQWIRRLCGKSHRFDSAANRCRPIFEVRECDEPMSSYVPPPVQSAPPSIYPDPASSFEYGVPLSGRDYQEKHVVDPFKGGYQSGRMGSNPFVAVGNTGTFYTEDGSRWVGSAWSEGGHRRRGAARRHQKHHHHSGDYVVVSGNPFGAGRDRMLNDEWKGRKVHDGPVRSSLTAARGHRVRNVVDQFKGRVSHFAPPLGAVNPFAVKRADGHRRRGRKNCRRDKHRRREDWEDEDCYEKEEREEREDEDEDERSILDELPVEESENTETVDESADDDERPVESEPVEEQKGEKTEEKEETETDPELMPESIDGEETEETEGAKELEKTEETEETEETTTGNGAVEEGRKEEDEEESEDGQSEAGESENAVEDINEDDVEKEFEDGETESAAESKPESLETEGKTEVKKEEEEEEEETPEMPETIEQTENGEEKEEEADAELSPEAVDREEADGVNAEEEQTEEKEEEETPEVPESVEQTENGEERDEEADAELTPEAIDSEETDGVNEEEEQTEEKEGETEETAEEENEAIEEPEEMEKEGEEGEKVEETEEMPAENGDNEGVEEEGKAETGETGEDGEGENGEVKEEETPETNDEAVETEDKGEEKEEAPETVEQSEETVDDTIEEEPEVKEEAVETNEKVVEDEVKEEKEDVETPESIGEPEETEDAVDDLNEDDVEKELEEGETESAAESKTDDVETPEALETEEKEETEVKEEETPEIPETVEQTENGEEKEEEADPEMSPEAIDSEETDAVNEEEEQTEEKEGETDDGEVDAEGAEDASDALDEAEAEQEMEQDGDKTEDGDSQALVPKIMANGNEGLGVEMTFNQDGQDAEKTEVAETPEESAEDDASKPESVEGGEENEAIEEPEEMEKEGGEEGEEGDVSEETENGEENDEEYEEPEERTENRRRRRSVVYDSSAQSPTRRLSLPRSSRLHRSRFSRLCVSSTPGQTISIGQCRQDFVYCKSARRPVVAACPVGDLFDAVASTCVPTEICGAERAERAKMDTPSKAVPYAPSTPTSSYVREGERPTMPVPTATTTHTPQKTAVVEDAECSSLTDGAYPLSPCSSQYFVCSASVKHVYSCPEGLVYHKKSDSCEWPVNVAACAGGATADPTSAPATEKSYAGPSVERDALATTVSPMHVHFDCVKDGGFAIDCKGGFVMCSNGYSSFMKCAHGLVFEESSQSCQYPAHVGSCGLTPVSSLDAPTTASPTATPTASPVYTPFSAPTTTAAPARAVEVLVTTPVDKDACSGVSSGLAGASLVCPSSFVICQQGQVTAVMNCPEGTFFDHKTKNCGYREVACGGGWSGEAHGVESPVEQDVPTVSPVTQSEEYGRREEYSRRASRPYRPSLPVAVEKMKEEEVKRDEVVVEEKPMVVPSTVEPVKGATCDWKGVAPSGACSSQFITCSNGRPEAFDCSTGLVFSPSTSACEYPQFVLGCPQYKEDSSSPVSPVSPLPTASPVSPVSTVSPSSTASPASDAVVVVDESFSPYSRDETPSTTTMLPLPALTTGEHSTAQFEATGDHCTFLADQPSFPLNYCSMTYAVCSAQGMAYRTNCTFGFLFDSVLRRCVPSEHCGQPYLKEIAGASRSPSSLQSLTGFSADSRCVGVKDGGLKATALCSGQYIKCEKESVVLQTCSGVGRVFSPLTGRCVQQAQMAECASSPRGIAPAITRPKTVPAPAPSADASSPVTYPTGLPPPSHRGARIRGGLPEPSSSTPFDARSFCTTKHSDGLYRNPENCAGIVQCFGGEAFSYPSCAEGLFFNEVDGHCDYASNVPECASQPDPVALDDSTASCKGQPHGAHLADDSDCSIYYRCVWGSLERLACPDGTVFNPRLSVCDYPSEVPHCQKH